MKAWTERNLPFFVAAASATAYGIVAPVFPVTPNAAPNLFSAIISVAAIAVGFLATVNSMLLAIDGRPVIAQLKAINLYGDMIAFLIRAEIWSFALAGWSILCFLPDLSAPEPWQRLFFSFWVFLIAGAAMSCYKVIGIFGKVLRSN